MQNAARETNNTTTFERYRVIIAGEVHKAHAVPWQRFRVLEQLQLWIAQFLTLLPLDRLPKLARIHQKLSRPWRSGESNQDRNHYRAIRYIRMAQMHYNILTVCSLRQGSRFAALQCYLLQSTWVYTAFIQTVVFIHVLLVAFEPTPDELEKGRNESHCPVSAGDQVALVSLACILIEVVDIICSR